MLKVLFFASVREQLGIESLHCAVEKNIAALIATLVAQHGARWESVLHAPNLIVAVNHEVVSLDHMLQAGDEVAFFPPVTGG